MRTLTGTIDGAAYIIQVPATWNGTLLLWSHGYRAPGSANPAENAPADLGPVAGAAGRLVEATEALAAALSRVARESPAPERLDAVNRGLMRLSRVLVPLAYTSGDRFAHDLAESVGGAIGRSVRIQMRDGARMRVSGSESSLSASSCAERGAIQSPRDAEQIANGRERQWRIGIPGK